MKRTFLNSMPEMEAEKLLIQMIFNGNLKPINDYKPFVPQQAGTEYQKTSWVRQWCRDTVRELRK